MDAGGNYRCFGEQLAPEFDKTQKVSVIVGNIVRRIKAVMKKPLTVKNEEFCCSGGGLQLPYIQVWDVPFLRCLFWVENEF